MAVFFGNLLSNNQSFETVDSPFSLLKVNWVAGKIPVDHLAAILVKIQPFLANRSGGENKRSERRVKILSDAGHSLATIFSFDPLIAEIDSVISISDPEKRRPRIRKPILFRGVLFLKFHDAEEQSNPNVVLMTARQARRIWQFVTERLDEIGTLVVHCEQGASRSPAVAAAVCRALGRDDSRFFQEYVPNRYVFNLVLRAAGTPVINRVGESDIRAQGP